MRNDPSRQLLLWDEPRDHSGRPPGEPGPPCPACGGPTVVGPGTPPHHARLKCTRCRAFRWQPKPRVARGGKP